MALSVNEKETGEKQEVCIINCYLEYFATLRVCGLQERHFRHVRLNRMNQNVLDRIAAS